jgi:hypothetical protein
LPILLISALPNAADLAQLYALDGHLRKPFEANSLLEAVSPLIPATALDP